MTREEQPSNGVLGSATLTNVNATLDNEPHGSPGCHIEFDALVVGTGFGGCYLIHALRKAGFSVKAVEAGSGLGGVWYWNRYPGARVDSPYPVYALNIPEVYKTWSWKEEYPGSEELRQYFDHVDSILDISKDVEFDTKVTAATWDASAERWRVECANGKTFVARFYLPCLGFAAKRHFPDWPGLHQFDGTILHSSFWPEGGIDVKGKRVAVIGTGATGIQIAQEVAADAAGLTVFCRTPNLCLPMRQAIVSPERAKKDLPLLADILDDAPNTLAGFPWQGHDVATFSHNAEEREAFYNEQWQAGGFRPVAHTYADMLVDPAANREMYDFWARRTRARISNPQKRDVLAPLEPPHYFGGKRPSLEQNYYEQMDLDHVEIVSVRDNPMKEVTPKGLVTADGRLREYDVIVICTGFDSVTGGLKAIETKGLGDVKLGDKWQNGTFTYLGMTTAGFPNMMFVYGPQSPTAYANGPTIVQAQGDWIVKVMSLMREGGRRTIDATHEAEAEFKKVVVDLHKLTLRDKTEGWYMGTNIPGKPREALNYGGGMPLYLKTLHEAVDQGWRGFVLQ